MSPLLSVIVPLHNAGELLSPFLDSLVNQQEKGLEIIIVNDGSTDGSDKVVADYARSYSHIQLVNQNNAGVSAARNNGLQLATGKYVAFPDADDILDPAMYSTLISIAEKNNLDVIQCNGERYFSAADEVKTIIPVDRVASTDVITGAEWLQQALSSRRFIHVVWLALYRRDLIMESQLYFEPGLHHQDIPWTTEIMLKAERVQYISQPLYRQRVHDASISNRKRTGQNNVNYQRHYMKIVGMLQELTTRYANKIVGKPAFHWQITREALGICHSIRREPDPAARQQIIDDFYEQGINKAMLRHAKGLKQWWQVCLWLWRLKKLSAHGQQTINNAHY